MINLKHTLVVAACTLPIISAQAMAETEFTLGAGVAYAPDYAGSDDYEASFLPVADVTWESDEKLETKEDELTVGVGLHSVHIGTMDGISVEFARAQFGNHVISKSIGVGLEGGRDQDDNKALRGLGDIDEYAVGKFAIEYGPAQPQGAQFFTAGLDMSFDISDETDGLVVTANAMSNHLFDEDIVLSHGPHVTWVNDDHSQAYFGISSTQAANSVYSQYDSDGGLQDAGYSVNLQYGITENIGAFAGATYAKLLGDAKDSPIVKDEGSDSQFVAYTGLIYSF